MDLSMEQATRERLAAYLAHGMTIDEFKSWLVAAMWNRPEKKGSRGIRFANEIKLAFAEHSSGFRPDAELRDMLLEILNPAPVEPR